jgi:hypothetical protein
MISGSQVAIYTSSSVLDTLLRAYTWPIIGVPQIFARGFPGNREDAILAGMIPITCIVLPYSHS